MIIISHRGYWEKESEKNQKASFLKSFELGFGTETDIRDAGGKLVISHDIPNGNEILFEDFCSLPGASAYTLALNIKSDGLAASIKDLTKKFQFENFFVFDMSIPDMLSHIRANNPVFTRMSDIEPEPLLLKESQGIWLDSFFSQWYDEKLVLKYLKSNKKVCIVSSELHGRNYDNLWKLLYPIRANNNLILCTDVPLKAKEYFK